MYHRPYDGKSPRTTNDSQAGAGQPLGLCSSLVQASGGQGEVSSRLTENQAEHSYPSPETRLMLESEDTIVVLAVTVAAHAQSGLELGCEGLRLTTPGW